jgi:type IV secretory pathway TrbL component
VTGPTNAAAEAAILADGTRVAPRALNALEVLVVGLLGVIPGAAADGVHGVLEALQTTRQNTFTALNLPIVPNPMPTVMPSGVLQVTVVSALNVIGAVIVPAFNHVLSALFETPDAFAQELAASGRLGKAIAAGAGAAATELAAAGTDIAGSVVAAVRDIRAAVQQNHRSRQSRGMDVTTSTGSPTTRSLAGRAADAGVQLPPGRSVVTSKRDTSESHGRRFQDTEHSGVEKAADHRANSTSSRISHDRPAHRGGRHRG